MNLLMGTKGAASLGLVGLGLVVGAFAAGEIAKGKIERSVSEMMPKYLGPADYYRTRVSASPFDLMGQRAPSVRVTGSNVHTAMGVTIDKLDVTLRGISFDASSRRLRSVRETEVTAQISSSNFLAYATRVYPDITEPVLTFGDGSFSLKARPEILGVRPSVAAEGTLDIQNGKAVNVKFARVSAVGISAPDFVQGWLERRLNPIFDAGSLGYNLSLKALEIKPGFVVMHGTADLTPETLNSLNSKPAVTNVDMQDGQTE